MRNVWQSGVEWDELITDNLFEDWKVWVAKLPEIEQIRVPRCLSGKREKAQSTQLHVFVDASQEAYASVAYFRFEYANQENEVVFAGSKCRVAPTKVLSVPRLELQAALLGARLSNMLKDIYIFEVDQQYFWTDSKTVKGWIYSMTRDFKTFVAHRISEILEYTTVKEWFWVPSEENVADEATKWCGHPEFVYASRWFKAPSFLWKDADCWPKEKIVQPEIKDMTERRVCLHVAATESDTIDSENFSSWKNLLRRASFIIRFPRNIRRKIQVQTICGEYITVEEMEIASIFFVYTSTIEVFCRRNPLTKQRFRA